MCQEPIKPNATKCVHCGSYQDFRRHINLGNSALALIIALVSVLTLGIPPILEAIQWVIPEKEDILLGVSDPTAENFKVYAYNNGNHFGILQANAAITVATDDGQELQENVTITSGVKGSISDLAINPGKYIIFFVITRKQQSILNDTKARTCEFQYSVFTPPDGERTQSVPFDCPRT